MKLQQRADKVVRPKQEKEKKDGKYPQKGWCVCVKYIWDIVIKVNVHKTEIPEETKREARAILW